MLGVDQGTAPPLTSISKRKQLFSTAMKRTSEWIYSQEIPSDIEVKVGGAILPLHKFPLVSKCGYIQKLISEVNYPNNSTIEIPDMPGGIEAFELVVKYCYGLNFEITAENIAMLRCAADHLEMTEEYSVGNLVSRTEAYLEEVALTGLSAAVTVLHKAEELLPMSEKVKLVSRCIDAVALMACSDSLSQLGSSSTTTDNFQEGFSLSSQSKPIVDWWAEELTVLRIDTFQRVLMAMKARGFRQYDIGPVIMLYAQKSLRGLDIFGRGRKKFDPKQEHEKRIILETVVNLLPRERNAMSVSFLSMLLRASIFLDTTVACRLDLEKRMSLQLGHAALDDLLIPSFTVDGDSTFDVDTVQRILINYLEHEANGSRGGYNTDDDFISPPRIDVEKVGRLMESYIAEIASDPNLTIARFTGLAELVPQRARINEDGMYRAIDIYLKAHPSLTDTERKKICGLMDCQKLSREACAHAAQNDRLPVQTVVQVLYSEQQRIRDTTGMSGSLTGADSPALSIRSGYSRSGGGTDEVWRLQRENDDLRMQLLRMKMHLKDSEIQPVKMAAADKPPLPKKTFMNSLSKKLGRLYPFSGADGARPFSGKARTKPPKDRRHSIS
ncbi:BTB/POZ domain-containing protein SR1IP1-like [Zingiber officinale]|uniref:Phototropic-responsive NPH3 family protein n=1 Tax=Zingiber officinale TaxID=94328 RepID=A0A8J5C5L1_ZINOF|nr:BTB/POZ domain-containing protein SR1IP1-like [Zingiber officinale]XP_042441583.1 BTB/POZ domain-containing protein SR1IP1-like [Zingiber officinale]KAG6473365.1 hypothetical protein ZIOFF_067280 [Zingiber officinale]